MKALRVKDIMTDNVVSVREEDSLAVIYDLMADNHIRHIPVVDREEDVIGVVSHRDLVQNALFSETELPFAEVRELLQTMRARDVMSKGVETVEADDLVCDAGRILLENKFGCLPVVEGTTLIGIITEADFVRHIVEEQSDTFTPSVRKITERRV